jgi:ribonuclease III
VLPLSLPGYTFQNTELLETALTHRSTGKNNNERLEFLGDSILGFVITEKLYQLFPNEPEGVLTRLRANLVNKETLAGLARQLDLGAAVKLGPGERKSGGWRRDSILSNTLESVIGAIYLDAGMTASKQFILSLYQELLANLDADNIGKDPKTVLQEILQAKKLPVPLYQIIDEQGDAHQKTFTVVCTIEDLGYRATAKGKSKRGAEQAAASLVLKEMTNKNA